MENVIPHKKLDSFSKYRSLIELTGGLSLNQVCTITSLSSASIQNWVKRGYVPKPQNKKYYERHLSRILLISSLRDSMNIEDIGMLLQLVNGETEDENDDIISESELYDYFCEAINKLEENYFPLDYLDVLLKKMINDIRYKERIILALKVMIYGHYAGQCINNVKVNIQLLKEKNPSKKE